MYSPTRAPTDADSGSVADPDAAVSPSSSGVAASSSVAIVHGTPSPGKNPSTVSRQYPNRFRSGFRLRSRFRLPIRGVLLRSGRRRSGHTVISPERHAPRGRGAFFARRSDART
ncbi:hypothetical protein GCM10027435_13610 [Haloparvum alkalitolerans]